MKILLLSLLLVSSCNEKTNRENLVNLNEEQTYKEPIKMNLKEGKEVATFAGGCFWCTEAVLFIVKRS